MYPDHFYFPPKRVSAGVISTESSLSGIAIGQNEASCKHCHAEYGHFITCPTINRNVAEANSALYGQASVAEKLLAHTLGVKL